MLILYIVSVTTFVRQSGEDLSSIHRVTNTHQPKAVCPHSEKVCHPL